MSERGAGIPMPSASERCVKRELVLPPFVDEFFGAGTNKRMQELFGSPYITSYETHISDGVFESTDELDEYLMLDTDTAAQVQRARVLAGAMVNGIKLNNINFALLELDQLVKKGDNGAKSARTANLFNSLNKVAESFEKVAGTKVIRFHATLFMQLLNSFLMLRLLSTAENRRMPDAAVGLRQLMEYNREARRVPGNPYNSDTYDPAEFLVSVDAYTRFLDIHPEQVSELSTTFGSESDRALQWHNDNLARYVVDQSVFKRVSSSFKKVFLLRDVPILVELLDMQTISHMARRDVSRICACLVTFLEPEQVKAPHLPKTHEASLRREKSSLDSEDDIAMMVKINENTAIFSLARESGDICPAFTPLSIGDVEHFLKKGRTMHQMLRFACLSAVKEYFDSKSPDVESYLKKDRPKEVLGGDKIPVSEVDSGIVEAVPSDTQETLIVPVSEVPVGSSKEESGSDGETYTHTFWSGGDLETDISKESFLSGETDITRLPLPRAISGTDVYATFVKLCGRPVRQKGSHAIFRLDDKTTPVPVKGHRRYGVGMLQKNLEMLGISRKDFLEAAGYTKK